jgi:transcriptional regulator with XRE-family HTH domain
MRTGRALALGMRRVRDRLGLTQAALAEKADVHEQFVSQLEREKRSPRIETLDAIAEALGLTPWDLLREGADEAPAPKAKDVLAARIRAVVTAWPEAERQQLLDVLAALGRVTHAANTTPAKKKVAKAAKR